MLGLPSPKGDFLPFVFPPIPGFPPSCCAWCPRSPLPTLLTTPRTAPNSRAGSVRTPCWCWSRLRQPCATAMWTGRFAEEDSLLYLTGLNEPETSLVLLPGEAAHQELLFVRDMIGNGSLERAHSHPRRSGQGQRDQGGRIGIALPALPAGGDGRSRLGRRRHRGGHAGVARARAHGQGRGLADPGRPRVRGRTDPGAQAGRGIAPQLSGTQVPRRLPAAGGDAHGTSPAEVATVQRAIDVTVEAQKAAMRRVRTATHEYRCKPRLNMSSAISAPAAGPFRASPRPAATRPRCITRATTIRSRQAH